LRRLLPASWTYASGSARVRSLFRIEKGPTFNSLVVATTVLSVLVRAKDCLVGWLEKTTHFYLCCVCMQAAATFAGLLFPITDKERYAGTDGWHGIDNI